MSHLEENKEIKEDLAIAYRVLGRLGLDDHTYTHLSSLASDGESFFIYPFGLRFEEVVADELLRVSFDGKILEGDEYQYNQTGYVLHGLIYKNRKDLKHIFHLHTEATVAVSSLKKGLLPINQWALHFYNQINYHQYNSLALSQDEHEKNLINDLGDKKILFMRNHGFIACGKTIYEAMFYSYHLERACKCQINTLACNMSIVTPNDAICKKANHDILNFEEELGKRDWLAWKRFDKSNYTEKQKNNIKQEIFDLKEEIEIF